MFGNVQDIRLVEALMVCDGLLQAGKFIVEYICYKIQEHVFVDKQDYIKNSELLRSRLINEYNGFYEIDTVDRYLFYGAVYTIYEITNFVTVKFLDTDMSALYYICLICALPGFQRMIMRPIKGRYDKYKVDRVIFLHYTICKTIIAAVGDLDNSIERIQNYHIFILYKYLTPDLVISFVKTYGFIYLLYFLKDTSATYYYYKAIKLAYYYSNGYLFNAISQDDSVYIVNVVIRERRWFDIDKIEIVHAFYRLINTRYKSERNALTTFQLYFIKFCTLWSVVFSLKLFTTGVMTVAFAGYLVGAEIVNPVVGVHRLKRYITSLVIYLLIVFHTNDLIVSSVFVIHPVIYYIVEEIIFFVKNSNDIHKILDFYNRKDKRILRTRTRRVSDSILSNKEYVVVK